MTWKNIISKAIDEAEQGGYKINRQEIHWGRLTSDNGYYSLIYNHDFIKAIFGNGDHY